MTTEILTVPEEKLEEVINVIRTGLNKSPVRISRETREALTKWCSEMQEYVDKLNGK